MFRKQQVTGSSPVIGSSHFESQSLAFEAGVFVFGRQRRSSSYATPSSREPQGATEWQKRGTRFGISKPNENLIS